jgi:hypothetical protein
MLKAEIVYKQEHYVADVVSGLKGSGIFKLYGHGDTRQEAIDTLEVQVKAIFGENAKLKIVA